MIKTKGICLILALLLMLQCLSFGVLATADTDQAPQTPAGTTAAATEATTAAPTEPPQPTVMVDGEAIPDVPFGQAGVAFGCKSLDARVPLGGSEKLLSTAKGVFVYETESDTVLYSYNPDERLAPGGLVQIVTALLVIENCDLDDMVTVSTYYINQLPLGIRHMSLQNGEVISVRDLLYAMLLTSANDAAVVLAQHVAETPGRFISMMNKWVRELGCENTVFTTVSGLDETGQYTTARDMARILDAAMENEDFRTLSATAAYTVEATNKSEIRELKTLNYLLEGAPLSRFVDSRVTGGKASYTSSAAGATIAFTARTEELDLVCVIIGTTRKYNSDSGSPSRYGNFEEAQDLMEYCFDQFQVSRLLYRGQTLLQLDVEDGANDVVAVNRSNIDIVLPAGTNLDDLTLKYDVVGGRLRAPVAADQEVATVQLWHGWACVGETTLYAMTDVAAAQAPGFTVQDGATRSDADMAQILLFLGVALAVVLVPVGIYYLINAIRKSLAKRRARKLRRQRRDQRMKSRRSRR